MGNEIKVGFGAKLEPSFKSTTEQVKDAVRQVAVETAKIYARQQFQKARTQAMIAEIKQAAVDAATRTSGAWESTTTAMRAGFMRMLPSVASAPGGVALLTGSVKILSGAMWLLNRANGEASNGLSKFGMIEDLAAKLRIVTGNAEIAKNKLKDLAATFTGTNVTLPDAVDAYRTAKVQSGGALSDKKGMTMLGDVAAASGNGIKDVATEVGKLYGDLQSGLPIQEATNKLSEMGIISSQVQKQMYLMQYQGKSGTEIWEMLASEFQKASGAMIEARNNLSSLQAGLAESKDKLSTAFAEGSVDFEKDKLKAQTILLEQLQPAAQEAGNVLGALKTKVSDLAKGFLSLIGVKQAADKALSNGEGLKKFVDVVIVAGVTLTAFAAGCILAFAGLATAALVSGAGIAGVFAALSVGAIAAGGAVVAAVVAVGGGLLLWARHMDEVNQRHASVETCQQTGVVDQTHTPRAAFHA